VAAKRRVGDIELVSRPTHEAGDQNDPMTFTASVPQGNAAAVFAAHSVRR
jgi:hypothetical protein